jgi:hypothetical protein
MQKRTVRRVCAAIVVAACSSAFGIEQAGRLPAAADELMRVYPGAHVHQEQNRVRIIYGTPMTPGLTARDAASAFIRLHGDAFGAGTLQVGEDWSADLNNGQFTVFCYQQYIGNVPVEYGCLKILVKNAPVPRVVYAAGTLAPAPAAGFADAAIGGEQAVRSVRSMRPWQHVPSWGAPSLVVYQGTGDWVAPSLAWEFEGWNPNPAAAFHRTFFVDAASGAILGIRDDVNYADVNGTIQGNGSPGVLPDASYNPPALLGVPQMRASIAGGDNAYTDDSGAFTITNPGTTPVTVSCGVNGAGAGRWVNVVPQGVGAITASLSNVTPPGPADLVLNPTPSEALTAQVNAFIATTVTHNYFKGLAPTFTRLDIAIPARTGVSGTCNAFFDGSSINFFNAGGGCVNTAYSTVVSHEYGHFIVSRLGPNGSGLAQNAFGEGYGDVNAEMIWNDAVTGRGFGGQGTYVRNPIAANIQYPCSNGDPHYCGQVVAAVWWRIRTAYGSFYGEPDGLDRARQLEVNWSLITTGGPDASNSAGPSTAIEVLTVDDDDGNLDNGTPNYGRICPAFGAQSIQCPVLMPLTFQYPNGRPTTVQPNQPTTIAVNVLQNTDPPQPGTGTVSYRIGSSGAYTTVSMAQGAPNQYTATLPAVPCGEAINYYFSAQSVTPLTQSDPPTAPARVFAAQSGAAALADLNFETDPGWTVTNTAIATGAWQRAVPVVGASMAPLSDYDGSGQCWVTDNRADTPNANFDVDGGPTVLTTGVYDLTPFSNATVSFARWIESVNGTPDPLLFQVSGDNGATWQTLETATNTAGWRQVSFDVPALTSQVRFRWSVSDNPSNSVTEAGVDAFQLFGFACNSACYANCDGSTSQPILNVNDFICFQSQFAAGNAYANCDQSTTPPVLNVNDFICFQTQFAAGCP